VVAVLLVTAVAVIVGTWSGSPSDTSSLSPNAGATGSSTRSETFTAEQRADRRCAVAVAAGVVFIQQDGSSASSELESKLGADSWIYQVILRANDYLNVALQRIRPEAEAVEHTAAEIDYLCNVRLRTVGLMRSGGSTDAIPNASSLLRTYLYSAAAVILITGGAAAAYSYFSGVSGLSGVSGVGNVDGFTGLTGVSGFTAPSGTTGTGPGGFTGVTGSSGISGITGGGVSGFSGGSGGTAGTS